MICNARYTWLAQLVERPTFNRVVEGSIPSFGALLLTIALVVKFVVAIDEPWVRFPDGASDTFAE